MAAADVGDPGAALQALDDAVEGRQLLAHQMGAIAGAEEALGPETPSLSQYLCGEHRFREYHLTQTSSDTSNGSNSKRYGKRGLEKGHTPASI
jgi:hypothetical protein